MGAGGAEAGGGQRVAPRILARCGPTSMPGCWGLLGKARKEAHHASNHAPRALDRDDCTSIAYLALVSAAGVGMANARDAAIALTRSGASRRSRSAASGRSS